MGTWGTAAFHNDDALDWIALRKQAAGSHVVALALEAIRRVREDSELKDLWTASPDHAARLKDLADLDARLR